MQVGEAMSREVLVIGPTHTLRDAAKLMASRRVGAAVVYDSDMDGPGILTERDVLTSVAAGQDPDAELACDHLTSELVYAAPEWTLEQAATAMLNGGFRHLVVNDSDGVAGILSVRDVVRVWTEQRSITGG